MQIENSITVYTSLYLVVTLSTLNIHEMYMKIIKAEFEYKRGVFHIFMCSQNTTRSPFLVEKILWKRPNLFIIDYGKAIMKYAFVNKNSFTSDRTIID